MAAGMHKRWAYFLLTVFILGAAIKEVYAKLVLNVLDPFPFTLITSVVAQITALGVVGARALARQQEEPRWDGPVWLRVTLLCLATFGALLFNNIATDLIGPVSYKIIDGISYPVFLVILAFFFLGEVISRRTLLAALIALVGFGVYYADQLPYLRVNLPGLLAAVISPFFFAISMVQIKWLLTRKIAPAKIVAARFSAITLAALFWLPGHFPRLAGEMWLLVLLIGSVGLAGLFLILFEALKHIPATHMTVFSASTPLFSAVTAYLLIPGTAYQLNHYLGLGIIVVGLASKVVEAEK